MTLIKKKVYIDEKSVSAMLKTVSIAGIEEQGVPFKRESTSLDEATQHVSLGNLTWIECVVDDIVSETPKILEKLNINIRILCILLYKGSPRWNIISH